MHISLRLSRFPVNTSIATFDLSIPITYLLLSIPALKKLDEPQKQSIIIDFSFDDC